MTTDEKVSFIKSLGYEIISNSLGNNLQVRCKNGHIFKRSFADFKKGSKKCLECLKYEKIKFITDLNYEIISENIGDHLEVKCKKGHIFKRPFTNFKKGAVKCPECLKETKTNLLHDLGYDIISEDLGHNTKVRCKNGHIFKRNFNNFKTGYINCPVCSIENKNNILNSMGYKIISDNLSDCLEVKCSKGHIFKRSFRTFLKGAVKCPKCIENEKKRILNDLGYKFLYDSYVQCKNGHIFERSIALFKSGCVGCVQCEKEYKTKLFDDLGYEIVSESLGDNLELKCKTGHIFKRTFSNFKKGAFLCPECYPSKSSFEKEISKLLDSYIENDYSVLGNKELDFYLPEHKLAIECNGDYWHSESNGKDKNYHLSKTNKCLEKGINLIHIFESSWNEKKDIWKSIINNKLNRSKRIFARKCILKEVLKDEEKEFLEENHLQGYVSSKICYGLYYNNELLSLMSFGKPRFTNKYDWELIRLCTKKNINVIGGASKLLKHFHKNNKGSIISYSDRLYSDGSIYKQLGFTFSHYSKPGYFYFKGNNKYSRQQFMKHKLKDKLEKFDPTLTEYENMVLNGFHRVWDCGQGVWVK